MGWCAFPHSKQLFTKSGCIHSITIIVKKVSTSIHKIHTHIATCFIILSISDYKVLILLMQPVNSEGHLSAHLQEMKQHAGHKKFKEGRTLTACFQHKSQHWHSPNYQLSVICGKSQIITRHDIPCTWKNELLEYPNTEVSPKCGKKNVSCRHPIE
jgi:hypothetical protein